MNDYNIKKLYEEMEIHLIESMQRNLGRHLLEEDKTGFEYPQWQTIKLKELKRYQRENRDIIKNDTKGLSKYVSNHLQKELKQGSLDAIKEYNKHHDNKLSPDELMTKSFFKVNDRKVNALIKSINDDLKTANTSALRMTNDQYRQIIHKSAFFVSNGAFTEQQAAKMAVKEITEKKMTTLAIDEASKNFLAGGLNCIEYKNGHKVNIASYAEMAVRTASLRAHLMGEGDFRKSIGRTLVQVTTHGESCDGCSNWEGKILVDDVYSGGKTDGKHTLLSEAMAQGLFHPNCRHGLTTYYEELEEISYDTPENDIQEELQDKINYYTRQEKKYDRLSVGSLDSDNRKIYKQKELLYEKKKDEYIEFSNIDKQLTKDERYSINKYIGFDSYTYNEKLRNDISLTAEEDKILNNLDSALKKMPKYKGNVTRSISISREDIDYFLKDYKEGNIIEYKAYTSSTIGDVYNPDARVQITIKSKNGRDITKYNNDEQEILFIRNSKFKVLKVDNSDDFYVRIDIEEV
jgi:hypothetical protein